MDAPTLNWEFWRLIVEALIIPILIRIWLVLSKIHSTLAVFNEKHKNTDTALDELKEWQIKQDERLENLSNKLSEYRNECAIRHGFSAKQKGRF